MNVIELFDKGRSIEQIAVSAGVRKCVVVADIKRHGRYIRYPLPRNQYEQINRMRRAARANEMQN